MYPKDFRYTNDHEWIKIEGKIGTVGITHHAQEELGDVVFVELPEPGLEIEAGKPVGSIESVKAVADLFSPVTGVVVEVNAALSETPELVNKDPHGEGWMLKVEIAAPAELDELMDLAAYEKFIAEGTV